jgi:hypothetical protein
VTFRALAALCLALWPGVSTPAGPSEYEVKAAFLYNFARFVEWPDDTVPAAGAAFQIAVLGEDPFGAALEDALAGKRILEHPLAVRRVKRAEDAVAAHIVFISASEAPRIERVLRVLAGHSVLTVGDTRDFARQGGIIGFKTEERKVRFEVNAQEAARARLKLSSHLLRLARLVETR